MSDKLEDRWQANIDSVFQGVKEVYISKRLSDISIWVEHTEFKAHKLVLAARSPEFQKLLFAPGIDNEIKIEDKSITRLAMGKLLCFIYTDELVTADEIEVIQVYVASLRFKQEKLKLKCESEINSWTITENNVWPILHAGYDLPLIISKCMIYLKSHINTALPVHYFPYIRFESLEILIDSGILKKVPVMQSLNRIMEWASNKFVVEEGNYGVVRTAFIENKILHKLSLETLTYEELSDVLIKYGGLLTADEIVLLMKYKRSEDLSFLNELHTKWINQENTNQ